MNDDERKTYCGQCKQAGLNKDCSSCNYALPELMNENYDAIDLWNRCHTQWIGGGMGIIGLNYDSVFKVADILGLEMTPSLLRKIQVMESEILKTMKKDKD